MRAMSELASGRAPTSESWSAVMMYEPEHLHECVYVSVASSISMSSADPPRRRAPASRHRFRPGKGRVSGQIVPVSYARVLMRQDFRRALT